MKSQEPITQEINLGKLVAEVREIFLNNSHLTEREKAKKVDMLNAIFEKVSPEDTEKRLKLRPTMPYSGYAYPGECIDRIFKAYRIDDEYNRNAVRNFIELLHQTHSSYYKRAEWIKTNRKPSPEQLSCLPMQIIEDHLNKYYTLPSSKYLKEHLDKNADNYRTEIVPFILKEDDRRVPVALDYLPVDKAIDVLVDAERIQNRREEVRNSKEMIELRQKYGNGLVPVMYYMQERTSGVPGAARDQFLYREEQPEGKIRKLVRPFEK